MTRLALTISGLIAGTALSAFASADDLKFIGLDYSGTLSGDVTFLDSSNQQHTLDVYIGKLKFQDGESQVETVCADLGSILDGSTHTYGVSFTDPNAGTGLSMAGNIVSADFSKATNANSGAALQLAVWSALYNGGTTFNADGSGFSVTGMSDAVLAQAATFYADFDTSGSAKYFHIAPGGGGQSQLAAVPAPEPASIAALGIGLAGLLARRRKARA